jgi:serine protease AprX
MAFIKNLGLCVILLMVISANAQVNRYMVFFKDKKNSPYSVSNPSAFLSQKAIERRINQNIEITIEDLPVNPAYVQGLRDMGVKTFFKSKWFNGILVQCDQSFLPSIENLPYIDHTEFVAPLSQLQRISQGRTKFNIPRKNAKQENVTDKQLNLIGIDYMHKAGYHGESKTIAILDAGFPGVDTIDAFENLFADGQINLAASYDFVYNTPNVFRYDDHGTEVFSVIAAQVAGSFTGGAYEANYQLYVTEDAPTEFRIEEYNWDFAAERADSAGADIISSSLGYYDFDLNSMNYDQSEMDGKTAVSTRAAQFAADRGMVVVVSAGNEGAIAWRIITAPADAKDVLAIANVDSNGTRSVSSSVGPSADNRVKPDVAAMGTAVKVINQRGKLSSVSGTSLSAPLITSLVAGVWQRFPELTSKEVNDLIRNSASQASFPDNFIGYGIANFKAAVNYHERMKNPQQQLFEVYPNPVKDTLVVSPRDPEAIPNCTLELLTADGKALARDTVQFNWVDRTYKADVSSLAGGLYYLRVWYEGRRYVFRVFKE